MTHRLRTAAGVSEAHSAAQTPSSDQRKQRQNGRTTKPGGHFLQSPMATSSKARDCITSIRDSDVTSRVRNQYLR